MYPEYEIKMMMIIPYGPMLTTRQRFQVLKCQLFSAFVSNWPVTRIWLVVEQNGLKFGTLGTSNTCGAP